MQKDHSIKGGLHVVLVQIENSSISRFVATAYQDRQVVNNQLYFISIIFVNKYLDYYHHIYSYFCIFINNLINNSYEQETL